MASHYKDKVIQVQKPAQSLQAFQKKVASGEDVQVGVLKPLLIGAGILVAGATAFFVYRTMSAGSLEKPICRYACVRRARYSVTKSSNWGGERKGFTLKQ